MKQRNKRSKGHEQGYGVGIVAKVVDEESAKEKKTRRENPQRRRRKESGLIANQGKSEES